MSVDKEKVVKYLKKNVGKEKSTKEIITESGALNIDAWPDNLIMFDLWRQVRDTAEENHMRLLMPKDVSGLPFNLKTQIVRH